MADSATKNPKIGSNLQPDSSVSAFRIYCLGTVAADFSGKSVEEDPEQRIEVFFDELYSGADGKIEARGDIRELNGKDSQGRDYTASTASTTSESCIWIPFGQNRRTAPNLRKGQRVVIWRTGDDDVYYWQPKGGDSHLMTTEDVIFTISATPKPREYGKGIDFDNCYFLMVNTAIKKASFGTSMGNGEAGIVQGMLDLNDLVLHITGHTGDENDPLANLYINFMEQLFRYENKSGSAIDIDKKVMTLTSPDVLNLIAKNTINIVTKQVFIQAETCQVTAMNWIGIVAGGVIWKTPSVTYTGSVNFTGEDGQTVTLNGDFNHVNGSWKSPAGNNVYGHTHGGVQYGNDRSDAFR